MYKRVHIVNNDISKHIHTGTNKLTKLFELHTDRHISILKIRNLDKYKKALCIYMKSNNYITCKTKNNKTYPFRKWFGKELKQIYRVDILWQYMTSNGAHIMKQGQGTPSPYTNVPSLGAGMA